MHVLAEHWRCAAVLSLCNCAVMVTSPPLVRHQICKASTHRRQRHAPSRRSHGTTSSTSSCTSTSMRQVTTSSVVTRGGVKYFGKLEEHCFWGNEVKLDEHHVDKLFAMFSHEKPKIEYYVCTINKTFATPGQCMLVMIVTLLSMPTFVRVKSTLSTSNASTTADFLSPFTASRHNVVSVFNRLCISSLYRF